MLPGILLVSQLTRIYFPVLKLKGILREQRAEISEGLPPKIWMWPGFPVITMSSPLSLLIAKGEEEASHHKTQGGHSHTPGPMHHGGHQSSQLRCFILKVRSEAGGKKRSQSSECKNREKLTGAYIWKVPYSKIKIRKNWVIELKFIRILIKSLFFPHINPK